MSNPAADFDPRNFVAYASAGITDPADPTRHVVVYVTPGVPGYWTTTYTGTLDYCEGVARSINQGRGITDDDVRAAVISSMAAQNRAAREAVAV